MEKKIYNHLICWTIFGLLDYYDRLDILKKYFLLEFISSLFIFYILSFLLNKYLFNKSFIYIISIFLCLIIESIIYISLNYKTFEPFQALSDIKKQERLFYHIDQIIKVSSISCAYTMYSYHANIQRTILSNLKRIYELKKENLTGQIYIHFIYNALNMIYSKTLNKYNELGNELIDLSDLLRNYLSNINSEK